MPSLMQGFTLNQSLTHCECSPVIHTGNDSIKGKEEMLVARKETHLWSYYCSSILKYISFLAADMTANSSWWHPGGRRTAVTEKRLWQRKDTDSYGKFFLSVWHPSTLRRRFRWRKTRRFGNALHRRYSWKRHFCVAVWTSNPEPFWKRWHTWVMWCSHVTN